MPKVIKKHAFLTVLRVFAIRGRLLRCSHLSVEQAHQKDDKKVPKVTFLQPFLKVMSGAA